MHQLTLHERVRIDGIWRTRTSQRQIAREIGRSPSTISRELRRNSDSAGYDGAMAHRRSLIRRQNRPIARKMDHTGLNFSVRQGLLRRWSPEQIAGRMRHEGLNPRVCAQTIYSWIRSQPDADHWRLFLRRRRRRPWRHYKARRIRAGAPVEGRPTAIERRGRLGDFEADMIIGPAGTGGLATLVCRRSRFLILLKLHTRNAVHVLAMLRSRLSALHPSQRRSVTFDNGGEFAQCHQLSADGVAVYFADPGCPYQRGTNENTNSLVRYYFPDRTNFRNVSASAVRRVEYLLNNRPRACLGYRTPAEVFHGHAMARCT